MRQADPGQSQGQFGGCRAGGLNPAVEKGTKAWPHKVIEKALELDGSHEEI